MMNNKSRPEVPVNLNSSLNVLHKRPKGDTNITDSKSSVTTRAIKKKSKSKKKLSSKSKSKQNKYVPGEYIYDTKGQMAEIKYIGQCHKGSGNWYGIEYVDGSLGKHNGTINDKTYFYGKDCRCDMIRGDKIRSKAIKPHPRKEDSFGDNHFQKKNNNDTNYRAQIIKKSAANAGASQSRHKRQTSEPSKFSSFASKSREEKVYHGNTHRRYRAKLKRVKTVKKAKYKGDKYIMAMEQENQKKRHERIGSIKKDKQRITRQKHERKSSQLQEIIKSKELKKEELLKLNEENKLRDLERIQLAKQKSKHRMNLSRNRSNSDHSNGLYREKEKIVYHTPNIPIEPLSPVHKVNQTPKQKVPPIFCDLSPTEQYNKEIPKTQNEMEPKRDLIIKEDEIDSVEEKDLSPIEEPIIPSMAISKSYDDVPALRSRSLSSSEVNTSPSVPLKRAESAPVISEYWMSHDDKGTDYWIKQYNKSLKNEKSKSKSKTKKKSKKKVLRSKSPKHSTSTRKVETIETSDTDVSLCRNTTKSPPNIDAKQNSKPTQSNLPEPNMPVLPLTNNINTSNKSNKRKQSNPILPALPDDNDSMSVESMAYARSESAISSSLLPNDEVITQDNIDSVKTELENMKHEEFCDEQIEISKNLSPINDKVRIKSLTSAIDSEIYHDEFEKEPFDEIRMNSRRSHQPMSLLYNYYQDNMMRMIYGQKLIDNSYRMHSMRCKRLNEMVDNKFKNDYFNNLRPKEYIFKPLRQMINVPLISRSQRTGIDLLRNNYLRRTFNVL